MRLLKLVLRKLTFWIWAPSACTIIFMKILLMPILFRDTVPINYWNLINIVRGIFEENHYFVLWGPSEGSLFFKLESSYSPGTNLWWLNSLKTNVNKICPTVQVLVRCNKYIHTDRCHSNNHFFILRGGWKCVNHNLEINFFHNQNTFSYILHTWSEQKKKCWKWEHSNVTIPTIHRSSWGLSTVFVWLKNTSETISQTACLADTQDNAENV
jgi:hypothetical protein